MTAGKSSNGVKVTRRKLSDYVTDPRNANKGTPRGTQMLETSVGKFGPARSGLADKDGIIRAGNQTAGQLYAAGIEDVIEVETTGKEWVVVRRADMDGKVGQEYALFDNRTGQLNLEWDGDTLAALANEGVDLSALWNDDELAALLEVDYLGSDKGKKPNPRQLPLDAIFTISSAPRCCVAVDAGFKYGIQSNARVLSGEGLCLFESKTRGHKLAFIDNDYFNYDHALHAACVRKYKPKYATVRDAMTPRQCADAGIAYYELEQILEWAEELAEHAANVIVIPKFDCIDRIPAKFMLGYSVPTSHGGTPLPVAAFKGRRVHLLGGSWTQQLEFLGALGEDVVSLDNNYENIRAEYGQFTDGEGVYHQREDVLPSEVTNPLMISLACGLGAMAAKINELCGTRPPPKPTLYLITSMNKTGVENGQSGIERTNRCLRGVHRSANDSRRDQFKNRAGRRTEFRRGHADLPVHIYAA